MSSNIIKRTAAALDGYQKKGNYLYVRRNGNWGFIDFLQEKAAGSEPSAIVFTVEISIVSQKLLDQFGGIYTSKKAGPKESHMSERLGYLMNYQTDYWWNMTASNEEEISKIVIDGILAYGIPFIDKMISDEALCQEWFEYFRAGKLFSADTCCYLVYLLKVTGRKDDFKQVAEFVVREHGHRPFNYVKRTTVSDFIEEITHS